MKNSVFFPFSAPLGYSMDSYLLQLTVVQGMIMGISKIPSNVLIHRYYIFQTDEGSTQDKIDFKLSLSCSSYLVGIPCNG